MEEIFGKLGKLMGKKTGSPSNSVVKYDGSKFLFDTGSSFEKSSAPIDQLQSYDWKSGGLSWVYQGSFHASYIDFSLANNAVYTFRGNWFDGDFKGEKFYGKFKGGTFLGDHFQSFYSDWGISPFYFAGNKVSGSDQGLLGIGKTNATVVDSKSNTKFVSLLAVPVGWYVNLTDSHGQTHSFVVQKTMDSTDSNWILQSTTGSKNKAILSWSQLKGSNESQYKTNTTLSVGSKFTIPKVFDGDPVGSIVSFEISPKTSASKLSASAKPKVYKFDLSLLKPFTFSSGSRKPVFTLKFDVDQEVDQYSKMLAEIKNGWFAFHLKTIVNALKQDIIDGYGRNIYLQDIFANEKGTKKAPKNIQESLDWLEEFVRVLVMNIVGSRKIKGRYVDSPRNQLMILNPIAKQVQTYLGAYTHPTPAPKTKKKPTKSSGSKTPVIKESVKEIIMRKILS